MVAGVYHRAASGYGVQTAALIRRLAAMPEVGGRENVAMALIDLVGPRAIVDGFPVFNLPDFSKEFTSLPQCSLASTAAIRECVEEFAPDVLLSLCDARRLPGMAAAVHPIPYCPYFPVDYVPPHPLDIQAVEGCHTAITMSKWGLAKLQEAGLSNGLYIPHAIESEFHVLTDRLPIIEFRRHLPRGTDHLTLMVGKNYADGRKNYEDQMQAWAEFARDKPGCTLYIHAPAPWEPGAPDLVELGEKCGISGRLVFSKGVDPLCGISAHRMALLYNAADVFLGCSLSEGFGVPIIEAQACGSPVVVGSYTAMPELVRGGYLVPYDAILPLDTIESYVFRPKFSSIVAGLNRMYSLWEQMGRRMSLEFRRDISKVVRNEYGWDVVFNQHWAPLLRQFSREG